MSDLSVVQPLKKTESKYDIVWKGTTFKLDAKPCRHGLELYYVATQEPPKDLPAFLAQLTSSAKIVDAEHVSLRWWDKLLGRTIESKAKKATEKMRARLFEKMRRTDEAERIRQSLG